ncbi:MAG: hypothetical protein QOG01_350 [Pseudonocardiales bacterium]|nr:hypothetical protein [Pseudonocardiales bacterium]
MRLTTTSAVLGIALVAALGGCGRGEGPGAGPTPTASYTSTEARQRVVDFVDKTIKATTTGLSLRDVDDAKTPEQCSPSEDSHNWTYSKDVVVQGDRARRLVDDVVAYWRGLGHTVTTPANLDALVHLDGGFNFGVHGVGPDGANGISIGGSSPCLPGPGSSVP